MAVVALDGVVKEFTVARRAGRFRRERSVVRAVDEVSLSIEAGEMVGYIGPNGAGKSTTVKLCTGVLVPTAGRVAVVGADPTGSRTDVVRRIGVVFGQRTQLWWDLPLRDSFDLLRHVYGVHADRHRTNVDAFVDLLDLAGFLDTPVRQLSLGQRMRGELAAALLHDPEILFLDEPTIGLDVVSKEAVRSFLVALNRERGMTVLLTTHDLVDVERLCTRLLIIDHGRLLEDTTVAGIKQRYGGERVLVVDLEEPHPPLEVPGAHVVRTDGPRQWLRFSPDRTAADVLARVAAQAPVRDISVEETPIEDIVRRIYEEGPR
ncbi:MAG TPA: ATP-binding cassette domain-containing protein [Acidimicrobiales bacterium]|nr:ATP-binding cassette domain-containing protein [Acidimicrobiales bacterium]